MSACSPGVMSVVGSVGYTTVVVVATGVVNHIVEGIGVVGYDEVEDEGGISPSTEITATL